MNCEKVRELLLTDYADGEIEEVERKEVDKHLEACPRCTEFNSALQQVREPFRKAGRVDVPEEVWEAIKGEVPREAVGRNSAGAVLSGIALFVRAHKGAFAAGVACVLVIGAATLSRIDFYGNAGSAELDAYLEEQAEFPVVNNGSMDLGTTIEEFFL